MNRFAAASLGVVLWALTASPAAYATGGRMVFSGNVVAPTCSPGTSLPAANNDHQDQRALCAAAPVHYTLRVEDAASAMPGSRLIDYQQTYLGAMGLAEPVRMATQTYE